MTATDLTITSSGPTLDWTRSYASQATGELSSTLGFGWQHPFATHLLTEAMAGGEPGHVVIVSPKGNRLRYRSLGDGTYEAYPGTYSTLTTTEDGFVQTMRDNQRFAFDAAGHLTTITDAQGKQLALTYENDHLVKIADQSNARRFFTLSYDATTNQISSVTDGAGRTVRYEYDANGDLARAFDVMNRPTTYQYENHLLVGIDDALEQPMMRTSYDGSTAASKAISQTLQDGRTLELTYLEASTVVTTTGVDGSQDVERISYNASNTMTGIVRNGVAVQSSLYDAQFAPGTVADGNGNVTQSTFNRFGQPERVTDALGGVTQAEYDARNRPITVTDVMGRKTLNVYDANNNLLRETTGITTSSPLGFTTVYTYNVRYPGKQWLEEQRSFDGVVTRYAYDTFGQIIKATVGYGTPLAQISTNGYDALGRVITSTVGVGTTLQRTDITRYNADDSIARRILNYKDGVFDANRPDEDASTTYGYDEVGRQVWERDALGRYDVVHYNARGQVDWGLRNLYPVSLNANGQPILPTTPPSYAPSRPDANVATFNGFDGLGRTVLVTQTGLLGGTFAPATQTWSATATRVTRTEYDTLNRPVTVTLNYQPSRPVGQLPDVNVQTITRYDNANNITWQRDTLGRWTNMRYDALNRPITVTLNYENGNPLTVDAANRAWTDGTDTDIVTAIRYLADGQVDHEIQNYVDGIFTAADPVADRITRYTYDALGQLVATTANDDPATATATTTRTDTNRRTTAAYDPRTGRLIGQQDALGRWISVQYDALGRQNATIQNCRNAQNQAVPQGCAPFDAATAVDRNVPTRLQYDALGRPTITTDAVGQMTQTLYDGLGRTRQMIENVVTGQAATVDRNVTTRTQYDAVGRIASITDAVGAVTSFTYNGLDQVAAEKDALGRITRMGYDGEGTQRWNVRPDGRLAVYQTDGLGRTTATIENFQDGTVTSADNMDRDLIAQTAYDAAGRRIRAVDTVGRVTAYAYDLLDRLVSVNENVVVGTCVAKPCNVLTRYTYDRAGNRTSIIDPLGYARRFTFDAADREIMYRDGLSRKTVTEYDKLDRKRVQRDPRGSAFDLTYRYDDLDRLFTLTSPNVSTPIELGYDARGQRRSLTDATGTTQFQYDALRRMTQVTAPGTGAVNYRYNARGERTKLTYPDASSIDYTYWLDGQLRAVYQGTAKLAAYAYDPAGRLQNVSRANGATTTYAYDQGDRITDLATSVNGTLRSRFQYRVDRSGNRTAVTESLPSTTSTLETRTVAYTYDGLQRLTEVAEQPGTRSIYSYDRAGNRTAVSVNGRVTESRSYDAANQVVGWQYDAAGNLLGDGSTQYTYDALNRLMSVNGTGVQRAYQYNGDGVLVAQSANGATTQFTQDLATPLSQILQTKQGTTTNYLYGQERLAAATGMARTWYIGDGLGSVRQTLGNGGASNGVQQYDAWGTPKTQAAPSVGFTGEWQDGAAGLVYLRARWYRPGQGTFLTRDPLVRQTLSEYGYADSDPVNGHDPSGLICATFLDETCQSIVDQHPEGSQQVADFAAGVLNGISIGQGPKILDGLGQEGKYDTCAGWYKVGDLSTLAIPGTGALKLVKQAPRAIKAVRQVPTLVKAVRGVPNLIKSLPKLRGLNAHAVLATRADEAVFWSGLRGDAVAARAWATNNRGMTLEMVAAKRGIKLPEWNRSDPHVVKMWEEASASLANGAKGNVRVLQEDAVRINSIWAKVEFPALKQNPSVNSITAINPRTGIEALLWSR